MLEWIASHEDDATAMNSAIQKNKTDIETLQTGEADSSDLRPRKMVILLEISGLIRVKSGRSFIMLFSLSKGEIVIMGSKHWKS